ncbi:phage tail terminator family protein [Lawsonibacter sp. LCP25S3_G6]|uniref:phage tail terminator family protein n=1 Tax=unclassified Lawsonibacter TaxID=2617946 RepID=UPI003F97B789
MLRINEILDAVDELMKERFPNSDAYRNLTPKDFKRPAFMVEMGKQTMETFTRDLVERTAEVTVTLFEEVDVRHNSQVEALGDRLTLALELFSCPAIQVGDRYLDLSAVHGDYFNDYAQVIFTLSWQDDRDLTPVEVPPLEDYDISVVPDGREEE